MRIKIIHKGLALILVPLALQIACFAWLFILVENSERLAAHEEKLVSLVECENSLTAEFTSALGSAVTVILRGPQHESISTYQERVSSLLREFRDLVADIPEGAEVLSEMNVAAENHFKLLQLLSESYQRAKGENLVERLHEVSALESRFRVEQQHADDVRQIIARQQVKLRTARTAEAEVRTQIKGQISVAVAAEILLTIVVVAMFLQNISDRLSVLVRNAELIPKELPLDRTVSGNDELTYLDTVLHKASADLRTAAEYRRSLMQMVAHDLRSPLMSAKLMTQQLLALTKGTAEPVTERLLELEKTSDLVIEFVEDLLTIDKLEAGKLNLNYDQFDLKEVVADSLEQLTPLAVRRQVTITSEVPSIKILADRHRILQVLNNLISNAIKFSPPHTEVSVKSERQIDLVKISVSDSGPGIPADRQARVFEKFYQAEEGGSEGFGLGLAICKLIVSEHDGSIGVSSEMGKGSTFWFTLKVDKEDS